MCFVNLNYIYNYSQKLRIVDITSGFDQYSSCFKPENWLTLAWLKSSANEYEIELLIVVSESDVMIKVLAETVLAYSLVFMLSVINQPIGGTTPKLFYAL